MGTHYFQWADQPATGRFDGENYNIGLVDVTDRPYPGLVEALKQTHRRVLRLHMGISKLDPRAAGRELTAARTGRAWRAWHGRLRLGRSALPAQAHRDQEPRHREQGEGQGQRDRRLGEAGQEHLPGLGRRSRVSGLLEFRITPTRAFVFPRGRNAVSDANVVVADSGRTIPRPRSEGRIANWMAAARAARPTIATKSVMMIPGLTFTSWVCARHRGERRRGRGVTGRHARAARAF